MKLIHYTFILSLVFTFSCSSEKKEKYVIDKEFKTYISGFSSGSISKKSDIRIELASLANPSTIGEAVDLDVFSFSPSIKGKTIWLDPSTIIFRPDETLDPDTEYEATFKLGEITDVPSQLKKFTFWFRTIKPSLRYDFDRMESMKDGDLTSQKLLGTIYTSDQESSTKIEELFSARQGSNELMVQWSHFEEAKTHRFEVQNVVRGEEPSEVVLKWNGSLIGADENDKDVISIPSLNDFKLLDVVVNTGSTKYVSLLFSDPIAKQDFTGLVSMKPYSKLRFSRDKNELKVYPQNKIMGKASLTIHTGIKNSLGYSLKEKTTRDIEFIQRKPEIRLLGDGVIIPNSEGLQFPFEAVNLSGVNVTVKKVFENNIKQFFQVNRINGGSQISRVARTVFEGNIPLNTQKNIDLGNWNTFALDLTKYMKAEPGAIYRVSLNCTPKQSLYSCVDNNFKDNFTKREKKDEDDWGYDDYYYDYRYEWRERDNPCHISYYLNNQRVVSRNIFASNLGIIVKANEAKSYQVAITDLRTTQPISGAKVVFYNYQQQIIASASTDDQGFVNVSLDKKPYLLVASQGEEKGYIRLDDGSSLSLSMFDVSGMNVQKGIKGFVYGERGVWRPGDSIFVSFLLNDQLNQLPENHPVVFELYDPMNQLVSKEVTSSGVEGLYSFRTKTTPQAKTGRYLAKVKVGSNVFTKNLRIEAIKPNRLKIKLDFPNELIGSTSASQKGSLDVKWLHGATAKNLTTKVDLDVSTTTTSFEGYKNYHFSDVSKSFYGLSKTVFSGKTNTEGKVSFSSNIKISKENVPGFLRAKYKTTVTEQGGNSSINSQSYLYSPFASYVGFSIPKGSGWGGALLTDEDYSVPIITLNEHGKAISKQGVSVQVLKIDRRWWMESDNSNYLSNFVSSSYKYQVHKTTVNTGTNGKGSFKLNVKNESGYGRYLVIIKDPSSGHSSSQLLYFDWPDWYSDKKEKEGDGATMLNFITNKQEYDLHDNITVSFPSTANARALVSVENGSQILQSFWVETSDKKTEFILDATPEMSPGAYLHISYIQPHAETSNDLPIRLYGIQRIRVNDPSRLLEPSIDLPNSLEPEKEFTVSVGEKNGQEMSYTLAIVEEGLLSLTNYRTPDPWNHFNAMEALGIKSWDLYQDVLGAFGGQLSGLLQVGGGEFEKGKVDEGYKANRFKPVVKFLGPFKLKKGKTNKHTVTLPNYIGAVRAMVVAGNGNAYGSKAKEVPVKKPLMVLGTMPRVLGPNEEVAVPVTVFAMDAKIKNVSVKLSGNELINFVGEKNKNISFSEEGEQMAYFKVKTPKQIGIGKLKVEASGSGFKAFHEFEIDVRNPNPYIHTVQDNMLKANEKWSTSLDPIGLPQTQETSLEVSKIPPIGLEKRLNELIRYPHGCIEQTTSSVFPQLYLKDLVSLDGIRQDKITNNIQKAIERIKGFQTSSGGFSYWPGGSYVSDWGTNYALHFLTEAKTKGYQVPSFMIENAMRYQKSKANSWSVGNVYYRSGSLMTQAYRLYTLAKAGKAEIGAMNRLRSLKELPNVVKARLAATYHLAGRTSASASLLADTKTTIETDVKTWRYTYGSSSRDKAMVIEAFSIAGKKDRLKNLITSLSSDLNSDQWMSTQTAAYSLLALSQFIGSGESASFKWSYELNGKKESVETKKPFASLPVELKSGESNTFSFDNKNDHPLFVKVIHSGRPIEQSISPSSSNLEMSVRYYGANRTSMDVSSIKQGTEFTCEVIIKNPGNKNDYDNLALSQIFPSGWEITNDRIFGESSSSGIDYQDIKDDRVYSYFSLNKGKSKTIRIKLTAAYEGNYYLAPFSCSAMYDNDISANNTGQRVSIVK